MNNESVKNDKVYLKDILLQKKPFQYKNENGEIVDMCECYSRTEEIYDDTGYFVKHFYAPAEKLAGIDIGDVVKVRFSHTYKKFYLGD